MAVRSVVTRYGWELLSKLHQASSSSGSSASKVPIQAREINESIFELHKPSGTPQLQVLFFHGLQFENSSHIHLSTWECGDGSCWPQTWLVEKFPDAHVLCVSYNGSITKNSQGVLDMYRVGENLISDLMQEDIGQILDCPIILVGHCFGGLVMKQVCIQAHRDLHERKEGLRNAKLQSFLSNVRGIFYYATPHHGSKLVEKTTQTEDNPLLTYFGSLSVQAARLNFDFDNICGRYGNWRIFALGEGVKTKLGHSKEDMMVSEASARVGAHHFYTMSGADHFSICKPENTCSGSYLHLVNFLKDIAEDAGVEAHNRKEAKVREDNRVDNFQILPEYLCGIEIPTEAVIGKLEKAATVGIVGMGGLGKTTLAKTIFNKLASQFDRFEYSCFVPKVKEIEGTVEQVKDKVWKFMHRHGKKVRGEEGWFSVRGKRLFLVLDDISEDTEVSLLSNIVKEIDSGSRVLVTTRDQKLLATLDDVYSIDVLEESVARELFSSHAFRNQQGPLSELNHLVEKIVRKCNGLPLALEVVGKSLYRRGYKEDWEQILCDWEETLWALVKASDVSYLNKKLWASLEVSYNRLSETEKKIFLDVTTFFSGNWNWTLRDAKGAWRVAYGTKSERLLWRTLVDLSLVYDVEDDETIKVHEQLQSLGRRIASQQRRVWDKQHGLELLQGTTELEDQAIYSLRLDREQGSNHEEIHITSGALQRLKVLHYLDVGDGIVIDGAPRCDPIDTKLILLNCGVVEFSQILVHSSLTKRLVGLKLELLDSREEEFLHFRDLKLPFYGTNDMQFYATRPIDRLVEEIGQFLQLEVLHLNYCRCDRLSEKFGQLAKLRRLHLIHFGNLCTLPYSFGQLKALSHLELRMCPKLGSLPDSFGELSSLNRLEFWSCDVLENLPASFGQLAALSYLEFHQCRKLHSLPDSFGQLRSLERLDFFECDELDKLPASFGQLRTLRYVIFYRCKQLRSLPDSFGELRSMDRLDFFECDELDKLPASFGQLKALRYLIFYKCRKLRSLSDSFGELSSLNRLEFSSCGELDNLPASFGQLKALSHLEFRTCEKLRSLPDSFGELSSLNRLEFRSCHELDKLPASFGQLKALSHLELHQCRQLCSLPGSFGELRSLDHLDLFQCDELDKLPASFGQLKALRYLIFYECRKLRSLPDSFGELISLNHLEFRSCDELDKLPASFGQLKALSRLEFRTCEKLRSLPDSFGELSSLNRLEFRSCRKLDKLPASFGQLKALSYLELRQCRQICSLPDSFGELRSLDRLLLFECDELDKLPASFGQLKALSYLIFYGCRKLRSLPDSFGELSSLNNLEVHHCDKLDNFPKSFKNLKALRRLEIRLCFKMQSLPESVGELPGLEYLAWAGGEKSRTLPNCLDYLKYRRVLDFNGRPTLFASREELRGDYSDVV